MYIVSNTTVKTSTQATLSANITNHNTSSEYYVLVQYINHNNSFITSIKEGVHDCTIQSFNVVDDENNISVRQAWLFFLPQDENFSKAQSVIEFNVLLKA